MALVKTVASSAPMVATANEMSTSGRRSIRPGAARKSPQQPATSSTEKAGDPRLARKPCVGDGAEHRRDGGGDELADAGGVGPQR